MTTRTVMATPSSVLSLRGLALDVDHAAECDDPRSPGLSEEWHDILEVHTPNSARRGAKWDPASSPAGIRDGYSRASCPRDARRVRLAVIIREEAAPLHVPRGVM